MTLDRDSCYRAVVARDERFDGLFFVGVSTTGIYCRPICPARTPGPTRCHFYRTAAAAECDGFRACLRCRPELSPGAAPVDALSRIVGTAVKRIEEGILNEGSLEDLARSMGVTSRHLRRAMQTELGISPVQLAQSRRVGLAKQLLQDTSLPVTQIAFASGFQSIRRFNSAFQSMYGRAPSELRKLRRSSTGGEKIQLTLEYRPPYDWKSILDFLRPRAVPGVELVREGEYLRTVRLGNHQGWVVLSPIKGRSALRAEVPLSLVPVLMPLVARLRRLFDLDAQPKAIARHLGRDRLLSQSVRSKPGLRVPGAFDGFEVAMRAILGQQVSVSAATTLYSRMVATLGAPIATPYPELSRLAPLPADVSSTSDGALIALGILPRRAATLRLIAGEVTAHRLLLDVGSTAEATIEQLKQLPGIGEWTAQYIAMRALSWPDAFPEGDLGVRKALGFVSARDARTLAELWRPWRAYAVMHLWTSSS